MKKYFLRFGWNFPQRSFWGREIHWSCQICMILLFSGSKMWVTCQNFEFLRSNLVRYFFSLILLKFSPEQFLKSRSSLIRSDLHGFAIFRVKIGVKGWNFDFYEVKFGPKFRSLTPFFTLKMTKTMLNWHNQWISQSQKLF